MIGNFKAKVLSTVLTESKTKKTPEVKVKLEILDNGDHVFADLWLTDNTFNRTMETLTVALGWNGEDLSDINDTNTLVGKECMVELEEESYTKDTGETAISTKVKWINSLAGRSQSRLDQTQAKVLAESLKGRILAYRKMKPSAPVDDGLKF